MHLFYVDESGTVADANQRFFVLAGVSVYERTTHWMEQELNAIAQRFDPHTPHAVELHGSPMMVGRNAWRKFRVPERSAAIADALRQVSAFRSKGVNVFAAVVEKSAALGRDPVEYAFECLNSRFDAFLKRLWLKQKDKQRGVMIFDKSSTEQRIQTLAREFKYSGHAWGKARNYAEVPLFLDSRASRLIQLADLVSYAIFRKYERGDAQFFDIIADCFDSEGGIQHGLHVLQAATDGTKGSL